MGCGTSAPKQGTKRLATTAGTMAAKSDEELAAAKSLSSQPSQEEWLPQASGQQSEIGDAAGDARDEAAPVNRLRTNSYRNSRVSFEELPEVPDDLFDAVDPHDPENAITTPGSLDD